MSKLYLEKEYVIFVNKKQLKVSEDKLTGQQILQMAGFNSNEYDLFEVEGNKSLPIDASSLVEIKNGLHFNALPRNVPYG